MASPQGHALGRLMRRLPAIDALKKRHSEAATGLPDGLWSQLCREVVQQARTAIVEGEVSDPQGLDGLLQAAIRERLAILRGPILRPLINGTGVLIHTNAGRAPLSAAALAAVAATSGGYCNLEISLATGQRGSRQSLLRPLLRWSCQAEDGLVVNNGAAAVMLALHALALHRPVIVSRGELVEIGGSFRVPDVMRAAGASLHEVGTTNRTHLADYRRAIEDLAEAGTPAAALLQVHRSNFEIRGFTAQPSLAELAELAHEYDMPLIVDLGSGALQSLAPLGLADEPTVAEVLSAGADIATFSGDKLVGGPQAGLIVGQQRWIRRLAGCAMARAVRVDAMVLAALEVVLRSHLLERASAELPIWQSMAHDDDHLLGTARTLAQSLRTGLSDRWQIDAVPGEAKMGGGSQPLATVPSRCLAIGHGAISAEGLERRLRAGQPPVIGRTRGDVLLLDLRSMLAGDPIEELSGSLLSALQAVERAVTVK